MVGDSNCGKSSIVTRFCDDVFSDNTMPTIGNITTYYNFLIIYFD